jgi:hypothetical protein
MQFLAGPHLFSFRQNWFPFFHEYGFWFQSPENAKKISSDGAETTALKLVSTFPTPILDFHLIFSHLNLPFSGFFVPSGVPLTKPNNPDEPY